jgi:hypothetical protein
MIGPSLAVSKTPCEDAHGYVQRDEGGDLVKLRIMALPHR